MEFVHLCLPCVINCDLLLIKNKIKMEFDRMYLLMFVLLPMFGFAQQRPYDPLLISSMSQKVDYKYIRVYTPDLACKNQKDTIIVQVLTEPFDDFLFDVVTELEELTYYMDSREKKYCPIYYDEIGTKNGKTILNVAFGSSDW